MSRSNLRVIYEEGPEAREDKEKAVEGGAKASEDGERGNLLTVCRGEEH